MMNDFSTTEIYTLRLLQNCSGTRSGEVDNVVGVISEDSMDVFIPFDTFPMTTLGHHWNLS